MDWLNKKCLPCEGGTEPLAKNKVNEYLSALPNWQAIEDYHKIAQDFILKDFRSALTFINKIGEIAENEGHHPDLELYSWNKVKIVLTTHAIDGLSDNDFILAAKINQLWNNQSGHLV